MDGTLSVCDLNTPSAEEEEEGAAAPMEGAPPPATAPPVGPTFSSLVGHTEAVLDCDLSESNQFLVSCSLDGSLVLWDVKSRRRLREMRAIDAAPGTSHVSFARFLPRNNNLVVCGVVGGSSSVVRVMNISTGKFLPCGGSPLLGRSLKAETGSSSCSGSDILWVGNDRGVVESFRLDASSPMAAQAHRKRTPPSAVQKGCRMTLNPGSLEAPTPVTALSAHACLKGGPCLLAALASPSGMAFHLMKVKDAFGSLEPLLRFAGDASLPPAPGCAALAPMLSFKDGTLAVAGTEDGSIAFYDLDKCGGASAHAQNKLLGHARPVIAVGFSHSEKFLATADAAGQVIVWKK